MTDIAQAPSEPRGLVFRYQRLVDATVFLFVSMGAIAIIEPSPYDFASLIAMPLWFLGGFSISRSFLVFGTLILAFNFMGFLALIPYWDSPDSSLYQYQSAYLVLTALFYALFMGNRTTHRVELCLNAYVAGSLIAAFTGILGYLNVAGLGEGVFLHAGRASGTFKDPNVLGSFLVLPIIYLAHSLMLGRAKSILLTGTMLLIIFLGMFLSFSRGSYGATVVAFTLMVVSVAFTMVAAAVAAFGAEVDDPVGGLDDFEIVLDDDDAVALRPPARAAPPELGDVVEMQARRRLVQNVERAAGGAAREFLGELDALRLAARERRRLLADMDVAEADARQRFELVADRRHGLEELGAFLDRHVEHVGDRLLLEGDTSSVSRS